MPELTDSEKILLKTLVDHFDQEDRSVRDRQILTWRRLKLMWESLQHYYYSEVAHDWRVPELERGGEDTDQSYYDKPVNVFRAYLESIIAALSVTIPPITCYPDDADNPLDISTAKAGDKIAELLFKHNDAPLLWLHALFIFCTEGMTASYVYTRESDEYGTYKENKYEEVTEENSTQVCPMCGAMMGETLEDFVPPGQMDMCPSCNEMVEPQTQSQINTVTKLVGQIDKPKSRVCMDVYGGTYVKVPIWARNQKDCNYLIFSYETHYTNALEQYPKLRDKITKGNTGYETYEQWGRLSPQYQGEYPQNNVTIRYAWLRPSAFNYFDEEDTEKFKKKYPKGVKVCLVNDFIADAFNQNLDDNWTLTYNPLSDYIHFDPIGLLLTSIQEITNDLISLTVQTVEHGIPQTFANPKVLDFKAYRNTEAIPGGIYPTIGGGNKPVSDGFYEVKTATLSSEVLPFAEKIQMLGQLVSGALPSLFGGQMSGSRTASEYSMSRAQALQRLQTTWKMLTMWWKSTFGKAIPMYIAEIKEDERQVKRDEFGNFVNSFVRKSELEGKIGSVELEANENLPITWSQQKDTIMELINTNNEMILSTLATPENMPYLKRAIGLTDYVVPGEDDRQKQYEEINLLVNSEPIVMPPDEMQVLQAVMNGQQPQPIELPSVEIDPDIDNHEIEADICRRWLVSDAGRLQKLENPAGYQNVLLHFKAHKQQIEMQAMQQMINQAPPDSSGKNPEKPTKEYGAKPPMQGEENADTVQ